MKPKSYFLQNPNCLGLVETYHVFDWETNLWLERLNPIVWGKEAALCDHLSLREAADFVQQHGCESHMQAVPSLLVNPFLELLK